MYCSNCGEKFHKKPNYCTHCGFDLRQVNEEEEMEPKVEEVVVESEKKEEVTPVETLEKVEAVPVHVVEVVPEEKPVEEPKEKKPETAEGVPLEKNKKKFEKK